MEVCKHHNCNSKATYAFQGADKAQLCLVHKFRGMVNFKMRNLSLTESMPTCNIASCKNFPTHGFNDLVARLCKEHSLAGMFDVSDNSRKKTAPKPLSFRPSKATAKVSSKASTKPSSKAASNSKNARQASFEPY